MHKAPARQTGVAVITAMLLTTLAVTLVGSLFWLQQVQIRSLENQHVQMQTQSVVHTTIDWARRVLREDAAKSAVDSLDEQWAVPLPETTLDDYLEAPHAPKEQADARAATVSARITDAQSKFNVRNLARDRTADAAQVATFKRLLGLIGQNPGLANAAVQALIATQSAAPAAGAPPAAALNKLRVPLVRLDDLMGTPGFSAEAIARLRPYVVVLPVATPVNVNTAGPEVLAAVMNTSTAQARAVVADRAKAYYKDLADFSNRAKLTPDGAVHAVRSDFFLLDATVRFPHGGQNLQALIYRKSTGNTTVKWARQF